MAGRDDIPNGISAGAWFRLTVATPDGYTQERWEQECREAIEPNGAPADVVVPPVTDDESLREFLDRINESYRSLGILPAGEAKPGWGDLTYGKLIADRKLADRVVRAISIEHDVDYIGALDLLERAFSRLGEEAPVRDIGEAAFINTGHDVYSMSFSTLDREVRKMETTEEAVHTTVLADSEALNQEAEVDDNGYVLLADSADRAKLLTDPYLVEDAYLRAKALDPNYNGDQGRKLFEQNHRFHIEQGLDLVGTLERNVAERQLRRTMNDRMAKVRRDEAEERAERARTRDLEAQAEELQRKMGRG